MLCWFGDSMLPEFEKGFSIVIPSWNNEPFLRKCIEYLRKYSEYDHQIIVHLNEGTRCQMTKKYLAEQKVFTTESKINFGVCAAVNKASELANRDLIMYFNDDMLALPGWDLELAKLASAYDFKEKIWLSSTMIEPFGNRPEMLAPYNFGTTLDDFCELTLLKNVEKLKFLNPDIGGTTWPPTLLYKNVFDKIGGFSEEYFPGFGSDPDLAKKCWDYGIRDFVGVGRSLVYHFQCVTTRRVSHKNNGHQIFKQQHGMSMDHFVNNILRRGHEWTHPEG